MRITIKVIPVIVQQMSVGYRVKNETEAWKMLDFWV
jgi:hypothetical protein